MSPDSMLRVAIVDDEPLARRGIRALLERHGDMHVTGEAGNGADAVAMLRQQPVDLLFLDVQMPGLDGFDVLASLEMATAPLVIFVTAFDQYAIRAFEQSAFDYLLKPVDPPRFELALSRARQRLEERTEGQIGRELARLLASRKANAMDGTTSQRTDRITFRDGSRLIVLDHDEVEWIGAEDDYVRVHTPRKTYLIRETLSSVARRVDSTSFVRIHRSTIVNVGCVRELVQAASQDAVVVLRSGERLRASRRYRDVLVARFGP